MTTLRVFRSTIPSVKFIFGNGKEAIFQQGFYYTDNLDEISVLESEVKHKHPHIYIDPEYSEVDSEMLDPAKALKAKILVGLSREELLAALAEQEAKATNPDNDMGKSVTEGVVLTNTKDIAAATVGGISSRLATLTVPKNF